MEHLKRGYVIIVIADLIIALFSFWISRYFGDLPRWYFLVAASVIWVAVSMLTHKLKFESYKRIRYAVAGVVLIDIVTGFFLYFIYKYFVPSYEYDKSILIATSLIIVFEVIMYGLFRKFVYRKIPFFYEEPIVENAARYEKCRNNEIVDEEIPQDLKMAINIVGNGKSVKEISELLSRSECFSGATVVLNSDNPEAIFKTKKKNLYLVIQTYSLNDIRHINTMLSYANYSLEEDGYILCHCTTSGIRREKIFKSNPVVIREIVYIVDYAFHRVFAKLSLFKNLYFRITKSKNRALSRVEVLGRFYRAGFDVIEEKIINDEFCVIGKKFREPIRDDKPSTGLLIRLKRKGKDGKEIGVYKFRTMYAYSEYIQPYIFKQEGLREGGKIADDYRVNAFGRIARKCWIDELPMLINWIKGDLKLVGVRPLSEHYFSLYSPDLQRLRIRTKPGLIPPFYADMPKTLDQIQQSERRYLTLYLSRPFATDWNYFWKAIYNIVFRGKRSK